MKHPTPIAACALLSSCLFLPEVRHEYDAACQVTSKQMVLTAEPMALIPVQGCTDEACAVLLATQVLLVPASAIVSGSIVLVGNTVFWLQKQGDCAAEPSTPQPGLAA